jgi:hypothetical protein
MTARASDPPAPWHALPARVAAALRPELPSVAGEIIDVIRREVPAYARPLEGPFGRGLRVGVEAALAHFVSEVEAGGPVERPDVYVALGRGEQRAGRTLDALLAAYRVGARIAWRRFAAAGVAAGLAPDVLYLLAESIFAFIDELSAESVAGFAQEQSAALGELQSRRRTLVRLLLREPAADPADIASAARSAEWALPRAIAVLVVSGEDREAVARRVPPDALSAPDGEALVVVVPDPDGPGRRAMLERALEGLGARAGLGPAVAPLDGRISHARARAVLELGAAPFAVADEHAVALLLRADPALGAELAATRLAPLDGLPAGARTRLRETLAAWLAHQGRVPEIAAALGIHPQTVRYRLARLRERFGSALDDPERRFELELALRAAESR